MVGITTGMCRGEISGLKWDYVRLESRFIISPITKNNTVRVLPINDTLYRIRSEIPEKSGYVFGNGNGGHIGASLSFSVQKSAHYGFPVPHPAIHLLQPFGHEASSRSHQWVLADSE